VEVLQLRIVLILIHQQQWYQEPAKPTFARLIPIFVRFALTSGEKCLIFVRLAIFLRILLFKMNQTKVISIFHYGKVEKNHFIFLSTFYPIMSLMKSPKNFEKIVILKI
jgi:hypothetical protein